jgi:hypothetical protein
VKQELIVVKKLKKPLIWMSLMLPESHWWYLFHKKSEELKLYNLT